MPHPINDEPPHESPKILPISALGSLALGAAFATLQHSSAYGRIVGAMMQAAQADIALAEHVERHRASLAMLGAKPGELDRMARFVLSLAQRTVVSNREVVLEGYAFNYYRMARGLPLVPVDIEPWLADFFHFGLTALIQAEYRRMGYDPVSAWRQVLITYVELKKVVAELWAEGQDAH